MINAEPKTSPGDVELENGSEVTVGSSVWVTPSDRGSLTVSGNGNLNVSGSGSLTISGNGSLTVSGSESVHSCPSSHTMVDDGFVHCSLNDSENEEENDDRATPENLPEDHSFASSDER